MTTQGQALVRREPGSLCGGLLDCSEKWTPDGYCRDRRCLACTEMPNHVSAADRWLDAALPRLGALRRIIKRGCCCSMS